MMIKNRKFKFRHFSIRLMDLMVILLFLFCVVSLSIYLLRKGKYVEVVVRVSDQDAIFVNWNSETSLWQLEALQPGMAQFDGLGRKSLEIVKVAIYPASQTSRIADVTLKIKAVYNRRTKQYTYQGDPLLIGATHIFKFNSLAMRGLIRDINNSADYETKAFIVEGELKPLFNNTSAFGWPGAFAGVSNTTGVPIYLADSIKVGDKLYDGQGNELVEILEVSKKPAVFILANTLPYQVIDNRNMEVQLKAEIQAEMFGDVPLYLGIQPIIIGKILSFNFEEKTINLTLSKVEVFTGIDK